MRKHGNGISTQYGRVTVQAAPGLVCLSLLGNAASQIMALTDGTVTATATFAGTQFTIGTTSNHGMVLTTDGANRIAIAAGGAVTLTPTSGVALTVDGVASQIGVQVNSGNSNSIGILVQDPGSNATQFRASTSNTQVTIQALGSGSTNMVLQTQEGVEMTLAGGVVVASASGGTQGLGTVNATAYYINGTDIVQTGTFTGTLTGCTTAPTVTFNYTITNNLQVTIDTPNGLQATSNSTTCTITGLPSLLVPPRNMNLLCTVVDNGASVLGDAFITPSQPTQITLSKAAGGLFTSSGVKGLGIFNVTYNLV
jgi:hypothetical protein